MRIHVSVDIDAPTDEVWQALEDISSHVEWMSDAESLEFTSDQTTGVGTEFVVATRVGPLRTSDRMRITEWIDGEVMGVEHHGAVSGTGQFTLTAHGSRTNFAWDESLTLPWWLGGRLGAVPGRVVLRHVWQRNLQALKDTIEQSNHAGRDDDVTIGTLVGTGRHGDVHEFGRTRVIRRDRNRASMAAQRSLMLWLHDHDYPLPQIYDHDDDAAVVMDRIDGPSMLDDLTSRPWMLASHARTLASLHDQLDAIPVPPEMDKGGKGDRIVHLDLHPGNVLLSASGPIVIDWANADVGPSGLDRAMTWVLIKTGSVDGNLAVQAVVRAFRERFAEAYRRAAGDAAVAAHATNAAELRMLDQNLRRDEAAEVFRLARSLQDQPVHSRTDDV